MTNATGKQPTASDTALVHYTGWRQRSGETFFTTRAAGQPIAIDLAHAAPGFAEVVPLLRIAVPGGIVVRRATEVTARSIFGHRQKFSLQRRLPGPNVNLPVIGRKEST